MPGAEAFFTSTISAPTPKNAVLQFIDKASRFASEGRQVDLHIVQFSVTDNDIVNRLIHSAQKHPIRSIKIIVDWCQGGPGSGRLMSRLEQLSPENVSVRYKRDQPYIYNSTADKMKWSYKASRGLLHHKLLILNLDSCPVLTAFGSYNWTARADRSSYENIVKLDDSDPDLHEIMNRFEEEFRALWTSSEASVSRKEAVELYRHIHNQYRSMPLRHASTISGKGIGCGLDRKNLFPDCLRFNPNNRGRCRVAFSYRGCDSSTYRNGISEVNTEQKFILTKPSGREKVIPLTLTALSLQLIHRARHGETLKIAMFAFSRRVAEFSALIDAGRRGVCIYILTDQRTSSSLVREIRGRRELPIYIKTGHRYMHQKYIIHPESGSVVTGTANLTVDSTRRHSENRVLFDCYESLCQQFEDNFDSMWARVQ